MVINHYLLINFRVYSKIFKEVLDSGTNPTGSHSRTHQDLPGAISPIPILDRDRQTQFFVHFTRSLFYILVPGHGISKVFLISLQTRCYECDSDVNSGALAQGATVQSHPWHQPVAYLTQLYGVGNQNP